MFSHWVEDAITVIDKLTVGPVILVGSTMGAWISLLAAQEIAEKEDKKKKLIAEELRANGTHENEITESAINFILNPKILGLGMYDFIIKRKVCYTQVLQFSVLRP